MLKVTEDAARFLAHVLEQKSAGPGRAVRLVEADPGWTMRLDTEVPGDQKVEHDGKTVLVIDAAVARTLSGITMDLDENQEVPRLRLTQAPGA